MSCHPIRLPIKYFTSSGEFFSSFSKFIIFMLGEHIRDCPSHLSSIRKKVFLEICDGGVFHGIGRNVIRSLAEKIMK